MCFVVSGVLKVDPFREGYVDVLLCVANWNSIHVARGICHVPSASRALKVDLFRQGYV